MRRMNINKIINKVDEMREMNKKKREKGELKKSLLRLWLQLRLADEFVRSRLYAVYTHKHIYTYPLYIIYMFTRAREIYIVSFDKLIFIFYIVNSLYLWIIFFSNFRLSPFGRHLFIGEDINVQLWIELLKKWHILL